MPVIIAPNRCVVPVLVDLTAVDRQPELEMKQRRWVVWFAYVSFGYEEAEGSQMCLAHGTFQ